MYTPEIWAVLVMTPFSILTALCAAMITIRKDAAPKMVDWCSMAATLDGLLTLLCVILVIMKWVFQYDLLVAIEADTSFSAFGWWVFITAQPIVAGISCWRVYETSALTTVCFTAWFTALTGTTYMVVLLVVKGELFRLF